MAKRSPTRGITTPKGFRAAGISAGIKESKQPDLALIVANSPCAAAGVFTTNKIPAAPVTVSRRHLRAGVAQAIVCNSGNANAATGRVGYQNARLMCKRVAQHVGLPQSDERLVLPNSTGIIGLQLPMDKIEAGIAALVPKLARGSNANAAAAEAIMSTDLVPKQAYRSARLGPKRKQQIHLGGICKGSGMIAPNLATMLAFITTDANISTRLLSTALSQAVFVSFNRISIDQHTSPSDSVLILASAAAGGPKISRPDQDYHHFQQALASLCQDLAYQIVRDGEGATKVIRVRVGHAANQKDADRIAKTVVDSPLVKTAVHGGDPNWGRIVTAVGYSGAAVKPEKLSLRIGARATAVGSRSLCVFANGQPTTLTITEQRRLTRIMPARKSSSSSIWARAGPAPSGSAAIYPVSTSRSTQITRRDTLFVAPLTATLTGYPSPPAPLRRSLMCRGSIEPG